LDHADQGLQDLLVLEGMCNHGNKNKLIMFTLKYIDSSWKLSILTGHVTIIC